MYAIRSYYEIRQHLFRLRKVRLSFVAGQHLLDHAAQSLIHEFAQETDAKHRAERDMCRTDRHAKLARHDHGHRRGERNAEGARSVDLGDFRPNGAYEPRPEQGEPDRYAQGADQHDPYRNSDLAADMPLDQHVDYAGKRTDRIGHVIRAMRKAQKGCGENQRHRITSYNVCYTKLLR